jgi:hypothetical protein
MKDDLHLLKPENVKSEEEAVVHFLESIHLLGVLSCVNKEFSFHIQSLFEQKEVSQETISNEIAKSIEDNKIFFDDIIFLPFHREFHHFIAPLHQKVYDRLFNLLSLYVQLPDQRNIKMRRGIGNTVCYLNVLVPQQYDFSKYYMNRWYEEQAPRDFVRLDVVHAAVIHLLKKTLLCMGPNSKLFLYSSASFGDKRAFSHNDKWDEGDEKLTFTAASTPGERGFYELIVQIDNKTMPDARCMLQ